jgi:hypothetical protein
VLQAIPILAVMPDDTVLGEFRADLRPTRRDQASPAPDAGAGFTGAVEIINSDTLLRLSTAIAQLVMRLPC